MSDLRELDAEVAEKVMGWTADVDGYGMYNWWGTKENPYIVKCCDFKPESDIAAAWMVVERMTSKGFSFSLTGCGLVSEWNRHPFGANFSKHGKVEGWKSTTLPIAICKAALEAIKHE